MRVIELSLDVVALLNAAHEFRITKEQGEQGAPPSYEVEYHTGIIEGFARERDLADAIRLAADHASRREQALAAVPPSRSSH